MSTVRLGRKLAGQRVLCCEVIPHVPDAWVDESKTKVGYEIPLNRHFYVYEPPRPLDEIESDLRDLEQEITGLLGEIVKN